MSVMILKKIDILLVEQYTLEFQDCMDYRSFIKNYIKVKILMPKKVTVISQPTFQNNPNYPYMVIVFQIE